MAPSFKSILFSLFKPRPRRHGPITPRDMVPANPARPSMAALDYDVLLLIMSYVAQLDPESLKNMSLACSGLYGAARFFQYSETRINVASDRAAESLQLVQTNYLAAVRSLHVTGCHIQDWDDTQPPSDRPVLAARERERDAWTTVGNLVPQMENLRHLHWSGSAIPDAVLDHLEQNSRIQLHLTLHVTLGRGATWQQTAPRLKQLQGRIAPNLASADITVSYIYPPFCTPVAHALRDLFLASPNLTAISLDIAPPRTDCIIHDRSRHRCGLGYTGGASLPPLHSLTITGYPFEIIPSTNLWECPRSLEMEYWARHTNWSALRHLELHCVRGHTEAIFLAKDLAPHLTARFKSAKFVRPPRNSMALGPDYLGPFFANLPPAVRLDELDISCFDALPYATDLLYDTALRTTPPLSSLRSLTLHRDPVCAREVALLREAFPRLERLSIVCCAGAPGEGEERECWAGGQWVAVFVELGWWEALRELEVAFVPQRGLRGVWFDRERAGGLVAGLNSESEGLSTARLRRMRFWVGVERQKGDDAVGMMGPRRRGPREGFEWVRDEGKGKIKGLVEVEGAATREDGEVGGWYHDVWDGRW